MKHFMENKLFSTDEENQIIAITAVTEKLRALLQKISSLLNADNTRGFYIMLKTMTEYGGKGTQTLADHIMSKLKILADDSSQICHDDDQVQSNKPKGLSFVYN